MGFWRYLMTGESMPAAQRDDSGMSSGVMPPSRDSTGTVSTSQAIGLEPVFRAVQILSTGVSQLTLDAYRGGSVLDDRQTASWVSRPNLDESLSAFLAESTAAMALRGNAFWLVQRSAASGDVANLRVLPNDEVSVSLKTDGTRVYGYKGKSLDSRTILQLQYLRIPGQAYGLGPIQAAQARLQGAVGLDAYAGDWFNTGGVPTGVLSTDQHLTTEQASNWRTQWTESQKARGTAVLGAGLAYSPVNLSPKDAQFLESQQFTTTALARLFGIPSHLMLAAVEGNSQTYANMQQADLGFTRWTLSTYYREIEEAFTGLLPRGQVARFNLNGILRPDTLTRYQAHQIALTAGFLTVNEVRALEGMEPLPQPTDNGGDNA